MMATRTTSKNVSLTCSVCDMTVAQAPGTRRTICPHCGHFYDTNASSNPQLLGARPPQPPARRLPNLDKERGPRAPASLDKEDRDRPNGRLQSFANFFQNLGPNRRNRKEGVDGNQGDSDNSSESHSPDHHNHKSTNGYHPQAAHLPPISQGSSSRLTAVKSPRGYVKSDGHPLSGHSGSRHPSGRITSAVPADSTLNQQNNNLNLKTADALRNDVKEAKDSNSWRDVQEIYASIFDSFTTINTAFKRDPSQEYKTTEDPGLKLDFVYVVFEQTEQLPQEVQKSVLKAIINSLLKDKRPHTKDDLRAYLVLSLNPQFAIASTYVIFAHLLRQMAALNDHDHHFLVHWYKRLSAAQFSALVKKLHNFISCRLFPPKPQDLPPMAKCSWWIPSATKVLALLNAANNLCNPTLISYIEFHNSALDHLDLMAEYYTWQNPSSHQGFSFCQYPFILSITAKRTILQRDSEQQMIVMARRSLVAKVQRREMPEIGMLFLNLTVRRLHLVSDSLNEIARKQHDLKKKLKVTFAGEPGLDMGGLTKEWFLLLVRQIFQQEYGMFCYDKKSRVFWFSSAPCENYQEFNLVGVLMGLAVYNSIILDIRFPAICYKKLLNPAVVPYNNPNATVGIVSVSVADLKQTMPDLAHGLQELLDYEGNVEDDFGMTFQVSYSELGDTRTCVLKEGGENILVTNKNRKEYVQLYVDYILNKSIYKQFQAFYHGFHSVCASNALIMLRPEEVELLVCGNPNLDMSALQKVVHYDGYKADDPIIRVLWDVILALPLEIQKRFLLFTTGSDRVPVGGMSEMQFKITRVDNTTMLPMSHTCFNQLVLPAYTGKKILKQKLLIAIQNAEGFGLE